MARSSETLKAVLEHRQFAVNVLADGQHVLSNNFARGAGDARWDGVDHGPLQTGLAALARALHAVGGSMSSIALSMAGRALAAGQVAA